MTNQLNQIINAVTTVFFQEGFDRKKGIHGLDYWKQVDDNRFVKRCFIDHPVDDEEITHRYMLNTKCIDNEWFLHLFRVIYDDNGYADDSSTLLLIPIDPNMLCWEEVGKCVTIIEFYLKTIMKEES